MTIECLGCGTPVEVSEQPENLRGVICGTCTNCGVLHIATVKAIPPSRVDLPEELTERWKK